MGLLNRLRGTDKPRMSAHQFQGAMNEWVDGATGFTRSTIITQFGLSVAEETELDAIKAIWNSANTNAKKLRMRKAFDSVCMLISDRDNTTWYQTNAEVMTRLNQAVS